VLLRRLLLLVLLACFDLLCVVMAVLVEPAAAVDVVTLTPLLAV
jgi:hypothetical protein